jgi:hypothetical protein
MAIIMANPLTNPDRFFAGISGREPNLLVPFVIVLITAIIPAIAEVICYFHAAAAGIAVELVAPFIVWFLFAGAFYAISIFFGGVGSFKRVLEFAGYGFIPQIPSAIFNAIIIHALLPTLASLPQFPTYEIAIIGLLLFLWSVAIWVFVSYACTQPIDTGCAFHGGRWRGCGLASVIVRSTRVISTTIR